MSRLARCLPETLDGEDDASADSVPLVAPESIWNGNEPRPFDIVEDWETVDMPSCFRLGGGRGSVVGLVPLVFTFAAEFPLANAC